MQINTVYSTCSNGRSPPVIDACTRSHVGWGFFGFPLLGFPLTPFFCSAPFSSHVFWQ